MVFNHGFLVTTLIIIQLFDALLLDDQTDSNLRDTTKPIKICRNFNQNYIKISTI